MRCTSNRSPILDVGAFDRLTPLSYVHQTFEHCGHTPASNRSVDPDDETLAAVIVHEAS
ncbi:MAG: hypothetical protein JWM63_130 [Gammaproteobacteria bacterium]|nr:hypothetical protein [Gammaproteobacteria bacterium]